MFRHLATFAVFFVLVSPVLSQNKHALRDENGRHVIPRGYVVNTNDGPYEVTFDADDYKRMVRMGANFQVIRLELGKLSKYPECSIDEVYLHKLDDLVRLGRNHGIKTVFKMTVYGVDSFSWPEFWENQNNEQGIYLNAWKVIWDRYQNDSSVYGYDLVNEPRKLEMNISYDHVTNEYLIPVYQKLIDEGNAINDTKMFLVQSIFQNKGDKTNGNQYTEMKQPINRDNIIFSPHIYQSKLDEIQATMERFEKESKLLDAPVFIGEWGFPTIESTDTTMKGDWGQLEYQRFYVHTAEAFDRMGIGAIKAWFLGTRRMQDFLTPGRSTWAIFSDDQEVGTVERKYITDIIARPFPMSIAGDIDSFFFDHATRSLDVHLHSNNSKGASRIFIGADRHYPDGFSVHCNDGLTLCRNPLSTVGLDPFKTDASSNPADFIWDSATQQLIVLAWPTDNTTVHLRIVPGINN